MKTCRILCVCSVGLITSNMVAARLTDKLAEKGWEATTQVTTPDEVRAELADADYDLIAPDICNLQIFDPGLVGNIGQLIGIAYMFLDVLPALFDDLVVHITPLVGKTAPAR